ncbi:MAG: hypothetical protein ACFFF4_10990 [Candidatus Thorarchaeota archaeon]
MRVQIWRFISFILVGAFLLSLCISPIAASRTRGGSGVLSTNESRESTINGYLNGEIEGTVTATEGPLEIYVIHDDDYEDVASISSFDCIVYEQTAYSVFSFSVLKEGDWVLILRNSNSYEVHYEFTWTSYGTGERIASTTSPMVLPLFLFLIALGYVISAQRGIIPEVKLSDTNPRYHTIIGLVFILLTLLIPVSIQIGLGSRQSILWMSLLWDLLYQSNPYAWIYPILFAGTTILYPFAMMSYYQGRMTKRRMIVIGMVSILPILSMGVLGLLTLLLSPSFPLRIIPLPVVFILGLLVTKYIPAPKVPERLDIENN